ncbi:hypothetical protein QC334_11770 [Streptomyces sp. DH18]|uniref:hypothetical protein n=1 Tax=unclassified Streptomyces TaxID=2593676 RepID=UPI001E3F9A3A|nr:MULTISPECIES: hypothetical protein [unclassified Streptomyces]MDG9683406.1 hypothetical protein [Streptomyces sp. DH18]
MKKIYAESLVDRISAINWQEEELSFTHGPSRAKLMREYLRRAALWVQELEKKNLIPPFGAGQPEDWPFVDIAHRIDSSVSPNAEISARLNDFLSEHASALLTGKICRFALNWASLPDEALSKFPDLPDPFEPLINLFERGGGFWVENGFIDFVAYRVRLSGWQEHIDRQPLSSLDSDYLDSLDEDQ